MYKLFKHSSQWLPWDIYRSWQGSQKLPNTSTAITGFLPHLTFHQTVSWTLYPGMGRHGHVNVVPGIVRAPQRPSWKPSSKRTPLSVRYCVSTLCKGPCKDVKDVNRWCCGSKCRREYGGQLCFVSVSTERNPHSPGPHSGQWKVPWKRHNKDVARWEQGYFTWFVRSMTKNKDCPPNLNLCPITELNSCTVCNVVLTLMLQSSKRTVGHLLQRCMC